MLTGDLGPVLALLQAPASLLEVVYFLGHPLLTARDSRFQRFEVPGSFIQKSREGPGVLSGAQSFLEELGVLREP